MPITIKTADHEAVAVRQMETPASSEDILAKLERHKGFSKQKGSPNKELLQSSFTDATDLPTLEVSANGFFDTIAGAYNSHHHLVLRPEDVWLAIITQFSYYVNAHAEELRETFVTHKGKEELELKYDGVTRYTVDVEMFARQMTDLLAGKVIDKGLREWILPSFSTTTDADLAIASIVMMGTLKAYFDFKMTLLCGIPSVTLLGERADWEDIFHRADRLALYGEEAQHFSKVLKPVLWRFVTSFDDPQSSEIRSFWERILRYNNPFSGKDSWSGWAVVFKYWDVEGKKQVRFPWESRFRVRDDDDVDYDEERMDSNGEEDPLALPETDEFGFLDVDSDATGYVSVPVLIDDNGVEVQAELLAGFVGFTCSPNEKALPGHAITSTDTSNVLDTVQPSSGWFMYEKAA